MGAENIIQTFKLSDIMKMTSTIRQTKIRLKRSISENAVDTLMVSQSTQVDVSSFVNTTNGSCPSEDTSINVEIEEIKDIIDKIVKHIGFPSSVVFKSSLEQTKRALSVKIHMPELEKTIERLLAIEKMVEIRDASNIHNTEYIGIHEPMHESKNTFGYGLQNSVLTSTTSAVIGDLLRLRVFPESITDHFPFTIKDYFDQRSRGITPEVDMTMSLELLRLSSFSTFPVDINISHIRLAQVGFYHTGRGKETKCYSCGVIYRDWISGDVPIAVHQRISPSCTLVTTDNYETTMNRERHEQLRQMSNKVQLHGNLENTSEALTPTTSVQNEHVVAASTNSMNSCAQRTSVANEQPEITSTLAQALTNNVVQTIYNGSEQFSESNQCQKKNDFASLGINVEKPRYPTYAPLQVRVSSYKGWPSYLDQTPQQMALAGFLYAGYNDYTRCFFCGGGLRNWEAGDDPWVEHARWFPQCAYVKQNKGEEFITAVLQRQEEIERGSESSVSNSNPPSNVSSPNTTQNAKDSQLNSVAARSVLEMGFTTNQVLNALQKINERSSGKRNIKAVDIMQILLDDNTGSINQETEGLTTGQDTASKDLAQGIESSGAALQHNRSKEENVSFNDLTEVHLDDTALLLEENRQLREQRLCKVCLDLDATIAFLPCGHIVCCTDCAPAMRKCPICRKYIKGTVKTYIA